MSLDYKNLRHKKPPSPSLSSVSSSASTLQPQSSSSRHPLPSQKEDVFDVTSAEAAAANTDPIKETHMEDVLVSSTARNPLSGNRKATLTKLHSIGKILIGNIGVKSLKALCTRMGIVGQRKNRKDVICEAIVKAKEDSSFVQIKDRVDSKESTKKESSGVWTIINRCRFLNVLFSDYIRPLLATLGATLSRCDLDKKIKQDQVFFEKVAREYNKSGIKTYDENAFPDISSSRMLSPSTFSAIDWKKGRDHLLDN